MQELKNWKENFEDISGSGSALPFDHAFNPSTILNVELREVLATPRKMPRQLREEIAGILIYELFSGKEYEIKDEKLFMGKFGVFYPIFLNIRNLEGWTEIKTLAGTNSMAGVFILRTLLDELFSLLDDCEKIESEFSKKFPKNLEKTLTALKKLINETYAIWEKKRLQAWEEKGLQGMKENSERQEKPDAAWEKQRTEEKDQENYLKNQENFLKDPDDETPENPGQKSEKMAGSEKLASMTREFMFSEKAGEALDSTVGEKIAAKIGELIPILEENHEMLEILSMLFPGRMWDYSLWSLHREYFGNLEKYAAVLRKNSDLREIIELVGRIELEYGSKKLNLSP